MNLCCTVFAIFIRISKSLHNEDYVRHIHLTVAVGIAFHLTYFNNIKVHRACERTVIVGYFKSRRTCLQSSYLKAAVLFHLNGYIVRSLYIAACGLFGDRIIETSLSCLADLHIRCFKIHCRSKINV